MPDTCGQCGVWCMVLRIGLKLCRLLSWQGRTVKLCLCGCRLAWQLPGHVIQCEPCCMDGSILQPAASDAQLLKLAHLYTVCVLYAGHG